MLLTVFLSIVILAAVTVMMLSAVAFIQDEKMFSSAPEEVRKLIRPRKTELFYGARTIGWTLPRRLKGATDLESDVCGFCILNKRGRIVL